MEDAASPSRPVHEELAALRGQVADLQAAQEMAEQIVETVREPLLVLTPDFRVQSANPAFYQLFQVQPGGDRRPAHLSARQWAMGYSRVAYLAGRDFAAEYGLQRL